MGHVGPRVQQVEQSREALSGQEGGGRGTAGEAAVEGGQSAEDAVGGELQRVGGGSGPGGVERRAV